MKYERNCGEQFWNTSSSLQIFRSRRNWPYSQGRSKSQGFFTCITSQLIYCISFRKCPGVVYIGKTGRGLGDRFRKHRLALPVPAHFAGMDHQLEDMQVAVVIAVLPEQDKRRREEMCFSLFIILAPSCRVVSIKISLSRDLLARTLACFYASIFIFSNFPL